ncbi:MAG: hypothetical protein O7B99_01360, partial [Planctomycetota bacterium]|nr:hypothetical protein [Planctomycetota bacterium]
MNTIYKRILSAGLVTGLVAAAALALPQDVRRGNRVNAGPGGPVESQPALKDAPSSIAGSGGAILIAGIQPNPHGIGPGTISGPGVFTSNGFLMNASPFSVQQALPNFFPTPLSGMAKQSGSLFFTFTGAFGEGGNVYHMPPGGGFILAGPGGFGVGLAGLAYDSTGALWASGDAFIVNDALYVIDIVTGLATGVGGFGSNICGVDGIAEDPTTNTLYGFTGFCYDGSPGDVLIIDKGTGAATDTGIDL